MKKLISVIVSMILVLSALTACGSSSSTATTAATTAPAATEAVTEAVTEAATEAVPEFKVAIVQQLDHSSLDEIRVAIENTLTAAQGVKITFKSFNGQNDNSMLNQIGAQVVADDYDAIIPIATLAAQCMATATEGTDTPVVYAAISDPEAAGLLDIPNVTGTSDALNTPFILDMMLSVQPDVKTVGLLYSNSEANSLTPIAQAKEYLDSKGIAYIEKTGNTTDEILTASSALAGRVDAVFTPTDNVVMAAENAVAEVLTSAGIPHYTGADSFVAAGAFTTSGVNYTELGTYTANMLIDILLGGEYPEYHVMEGGIITVNTDTAAALNLDYTPFKSMANTVVEVTTG